MPLYPGAALTVQATRALASAIKPTDQVFNSAVLAPVTGMALAVPGPGNFEFTIVAIYSGDTSASAPLTVDVTGPAVTVTAYRLYVQGSNTSKTENGKTAFASSVTGTAVATGGSQYVVIAQGALVATAAGTIQLEAATDGVHTNTVYAGSYAVLRELI